MKKLLRLFIAFLCLFCISVNAETSTKQIDASTCKEIKTNYYFMLEANTRDFFKSPVTKTNVATFENNAYLLSNFDDKNVGYGKVEITKNSTASSDTITSWSLEDFYKYYNAISENYGVFDDGDRLYFAHTKWYDENISTQTRTERKGGVSTTSVSINDLIDATVEADTTIERETQIIPGSSYDFNLSITRSYNVDYNSLGRGVKIGYYNWYFQPQIYYVQYCESTNNDNSTSNVEESAPVVISTYKVMYDKNTPDDVYNLPNNEEIANDKDALISTSIPTRNGYTFLGWALSPTDTKIAYNIGDTYTGRSDITLYAIWQEKGTYETTSSEVDNPQTDIKTSAISFVGVSFAAISGLFVLMKKGFLRQI